MKCINRVTCVTVAFLILGCLEKPKKVVYFEGEVAVVGKFKVNKIPNVIRRLAHPYVKENQSDTILIPKLMLVRLDDNKTDTLILFEEQKKDFADWVLETLGGGSSGKLNEITKYIDNQLSSIEIPESFLKESQFIHAQDYIQKNINIFDNKTILYLDTTYSSIIKIQGHTENLIKICFNIDDARKSILDNINENLKSPRLLYIELDKITDVTDSTLKQTKVFKPLIRQKPNLEIQSALSSTAKMLSDVKQVIELSDVPNMKKYSLLKQYKDSISILISQNKNLLERDKQYNNEKNTLLLNLKSLTENLQAQTFMIESLQNQIMEKEKEIKRLRTVQYCIIKKEEADELEILKRDGVGLKGFGIGNREIQIDWEKVRSVSNDLSFSKIDIEETEINIGIAKTDNIVILPKRVKGSFQLNQSGNNVILKIIDSENFWRDKKIFIIIE